MSRRKGDGVAFDHCATCAMRFGMPAAFKAQREKDHLVFFCPSGHQNVYAAPKPGDVKAQVARLEAEAKALRDEKAKLLARIDQLEAKG